MGYRTKARTRELICDFPGLEPDDGCEPLRATVIASLTFDDQDTIPHPLYVDNGKTMYRSTTEMREAIAPYVLAWNCEAVNRETGTVEPVPAPADGGPDVFRVVDTVIAVWLALCLRGAWQSADEKKDSSIDTAPSAAMPPPSPVASSGSKTRPSRSRSNRRASASPSGSI